MPLVIHPRVRKGLRRGVALAALACVAAPGVAHAACTQDTTTRAFAQFGDTADYKLAPGGAFESGAQDWTLNGNAIVADNEPFFTAGAGDSHALSIKPGTSVVSPEFCVDASNPYLRLFAKKVWLPGTLNVDLLYTTADGHAYERQAGSVLGSGLTDWAPTPVLNLAAAMQSGKLAQGDATVRLRFTASQDAGAWTIDDVWVDPFRFG